MNEYLIWTIVITVCLFILIAIRFLGAKKTSYKLSSIEEFYENNSLKRVYFIDKENRKQGVDKFFYRNQTINKEQQWVNDQLEGESKVYYSNGKIYIHSSYHSNELNGDFKVYDKNGALIQHQLYDRGSLKMIIKDLKTTKNKVESSQNFVSSPLMDERTNKEFHAKKSVYLKIKDSEETKDAERNKKGVWSGLNKMVKIVSGIQASRNRKSALTIKKSCEEYFVGAQDITDRIRKKLNLKINEFGKYRLESLHATTGRFLGILKDMKRENLIKEYEILNNIGINTESLRNMERLDMEVSTALRSSATVSVLGAAAAMGTPALVSSTIGAFATASTGTAISTLSGAAATNATLAWLGGGSLAAGGGGVAAGATILSGITIGATAGVGVAAAGIIASTYYSKKLTEAKEFQKNVESYVADMEALWGILEGINKRTDELNHVTRIIEDRLRSEMDYLEPLAVDYLTDNAYYISIFQRAGLLAKSMSDLAQTPLLDESGNTSIASTQIIQDTYKVLNTKLINHG
jgi:hypothetical protein